MGRASAAVAFSCCCGDTSDPSWVNLAHSQGRWQLKLCEVASIYFGFGQIRSEANTCRWTSSESKPASKPLHSPSGNPCLQFQISTAEGTKSFTHPMSNRSKIPYSWKTDTDFFPHHNFICMKIPQLALFLGHDKEQWFLGPKGNRSGKKTQTSVEKVHWSEVSPKVYSFHYINWI